MADAKAHIHVSRLRLPEIPDEFLAGVRLYKFDDLNKPAVTGDYVTAFLDPKGHVMYWKRITTGMTEVLDLMNVCDTRIAKHAKAPKESDRTSFVSINNDCMFTVVTFGFRDAGGRELTFREPNFTTFIAQSPDIAKMWADKIFEIGTSIAILNASPLHYLSHNYARLRYAVNPEGLIHTADIAKMFAVDKDARKRVEQVMIAAGLPKDEAIPPESFTENDFFRLYRQLTQRTEVYSIFKKIQKNRNTSDSMDATVSTADLMTFLNEEQRDPRLNEILYPNHTLESAQRLIDIYESDPVLARSGQLSIEGFLGFLLSEDNAPLSEDAYDLRKDVLDQPLSHYFIASSHNTYLTDRQVGLPGVSRAPASVEFYRQVLLTGCRSVELDCWDGSDGDPIIMHGNAYTEVLLFKDVLRAINESAFKTSDLPVILSFENKAKRQQPVMAKYCKEIFGSSLLDEPLPGYPLEPGFPTPPPQLLKRKIIIKNQKKTVQPGRNQSRQSSVKTGTSTYVSYLPETSISSSVSDSNLPSDSASEVLDEGIEISDTSNEDDVEDDLSQIAPLEDGLGADGAVEDAVTLSGTLSTPIVEEKEECSAGVIISTLVNYVQGVKIEPSGKGLEEAEERNCSFHVTSWTSSSATKLLEMKGFELVNYNRRQLSRIYPNAGMIDSRNYLPQVPWNAGCQMVALNYQTLDFGMQLNLGFFERNGRCGYVLKPECMRKRDQFMDPFEETSVENVVANTLSVEVLSGQLVTDRKVATYVLVELYGQINDSRRNTYKSKKTDNTINPNYVSYLESFNFPKIILPEMATLRLAVCEEGGKLIAQRFLPVIGLRPGYRHIVLRNLLNRPYGMATLFVKIQVKDFVPESHAEFADALVNPIAFVTEQQKRSEMLKALVDEDEEAAGTPGGTAPVGMAGQENMKKSFEHEAKPSSDNPDKSTPTHQLPKPAFNRYPHHPPTSVAELLPVPIPTLVELMETKSVSQMLKVQSMELQELRKRFEKEKYSLKKKHGRRSADNLKLPIPGNNNPVRFPSLSSLLKPEKDAAKKNNNEAPVTNGEPSTGKVLQKMNSVDEVKSEEYERLRLQFLEEEITMRKKHKDEWRRKGELIINEKQRLSQKAIAARYKKEKDAIIKMNADSKKRMILEIKAASKAEHKIAKDAIESDFFHRSVNAGRQLKMDEDNKLEETKKGFEKLREKLAESYREKLSELDAEYEKKKSDDYWPGTTITRL